MPTPKSQMAMVEVVRSILKTKDTDVWSISPDATVYDAIGMMADKGIGALPVLDESKIIGILSERDYARRVILQGRSSKETRVCEIMTNSVITVTPDNTVAECMEIMTNRRIRHLPVVDRERLVGIVSIGDLVKAIISAQEHAIAQLSSYITGEYPR